MCAFQSPMYECVSIICIRAEQQSTKAKIENLIYEKSLIL